MLTFPSTYNSALVTVATGLVAKQMITKLLVIRTRVGDSLFIWPEDYPALKKLLPLLQYSLLATPKGKQEGEEVLTRYNAIERSNAENEPYYLIAAAAWGLVASPPAYAVSLIYSYFASRVAHSLCFIYKLEPYRTLFYCSGFGITIFTTAQALLASKK